MNTSDRIAGSLLAGACGDALGEPVEFMTLEGIRRHYGTQGIVDLEPPGHISDDTQMTLFTAEGLLDAVAAGPANDEALLAAVHRASWRWLETQSGSRLRAEGALALMNEPRLFERRAPGNTCISALVEGGRAGDFAYNDSKGCGGVMRVAPIGLMFYRDPARAFGLGERAARQTHGHPTGYLAAGAQAMLVALLSDGTDLDTALAATLDRLRTIPGGEETAWALRNARPLAAEIENDMASLGWVAEEALGVAVGCILVTDSLEAAVIRAANHSGDCDSTAAIAGNLAGALYGIESIPARWRNGVEMGDLILRAAACLETAAR